MEADQFDHAIQGHRLLLFIDSYPLVTNQRMGDTASYLRGLGQALDKVIVVASTLTMNQLYPAHEYGQSNPGTIFWEHKITSFEILETNKLAQIYLSNTGVKID